MRPLHIAQRSRLCAVLMTSILALTLAACGGSSAKSKTAASTPTPGIVDETGLRAVADQQLQYSKNRDWARLYATYSPEVQAECTEAEFVSQRDAQVQRGFDPAKVAQTIASIRADGDHAYITWNIAYGGTPVAASNAAEDVYVRIDGKWYDAPDANTGCAKTATATPGAASSGAASATPAKTPAP
jgi:hypothetical protein